MPEKYKHRSTGVVYDVRSRGRATWGGYNETILVSPRGRVRRLSDRALAEEYEAVESDDA